MDSVAGKNNPSGLMATSANTQNQLTGLGMSYDAAGNVTHDNLGNNYTYDAENRIIFANGVQYGYDGDGKRIGKSTGTLYWTGVGSDALTETDLNGNPTADYFYFNGTRVGRVDRPSGVEHIYINDDLGTARMVATPASYNTVTFSDSDYSPYGIELPISGADSNHYKFTGKERDSESGLDNFGKRYFASSMGRWMSPDLVNVTEDRVVNPANTLNKYVYGGNNPLKYIDPDGQDITYFYDPGGVAGHAVLFAYNQATGDSAIESFGPKVPSPVWTGESNFDMNEFNSAQGLRDNYASLTIQTTPELAQQVIDYIRANPDPKFWTFLGPNCSSEVQKILKRFKLNAQGYHWPGMTPKTLWGSLLFRYNPNLTFTRDSTHPKQGRDYGNPRFDMFNLLWLSLPQSQPKASVTVTVTNCVTDDKGKKVCNSQ
jgi:RHS repeat-associated protein